MFPDSLRSMMRIALLAAACSLSVTPAFGQSPYESLGSRALGMAGAFVAVADDATAAYWNPAGLATGGAFSATFEWSRFQNGNPDVPPEPGLGRGTSTFSSLGTWPLALSFGRLTSEVLVDASDGTTAARRLSTSQYAATLLQTVVPGLVVGSTLKYVRGSLSTGGAEGPTAGAALDRLDDLDSRTEGAFDLDVGVMADMRAVRVGLVWKNLRTPEFEDVAGNATELPRLVRLGVAVFPTNGLTLAMDMDLDTVDLRDGLRRMIALGGECHLGARFAVRSGVRWNTEGARRQPVASLGASVALQPRLWLDGHYSRGRSAQDHVVGLALRAGY